MKKPTSQQVHAIASGAGLWTVQLAVIYVAPLLVVVLVSALFQAPDSAAWQGIEFCLFSILALGGAMWASRRVKSAARTGIWIWPLPISVLVGVVVWDICLGMPDSILDYFVGVGEAGWIKLFVTLPAWSCCLYSATLACSLGRDNSMS